jgi:hypothetical protein
MAFCNTPTQESAQGLRLGSSKWKVQNGRLIRAFPPTDGAGELPNRAAGRVKVIRGIGYLLNCGDVDLPSPTGNTNNPLKAVIVWPPILPSSNSQVSRSCKSDE